MMGKPGELDWGLVEIEKNPMQDLGWQELSWGTSKLDTGKW